MIIARFRIDTKAIPGGCAVVSNLSLTDSFFKKSERGAQTFPKLLLRNSSQLRFGIVNIIDIDTIEIHVAKRLGQLVLEISRRHAVRAAGNLTPGGNAGFDEVLFNILAHVRRRRSVKRQVTAFRTNHEFFPRKSALMQRTEGRANRSLTSLKAIIGGRINHVGAQLGSAHHRIAVALIEIFGWLAEVSADAY